MNVTDTTSQQPDMVTLEKGASRKQVISARRPGGDELAIFDAFSSAPHQVAAQMVFGGRGFMEAARACTGDGQWPLMWLQGDVCPGTHVAGAQMFTLQGQPLKRVRLGNRVVGTAWSDENADYCLLAGVLPANLGAAPGAQTRSCFEEIEAGLVEAGMDFTHVVRTWFYMDHLLDWYDDFNAARTAFFEEHGVFDRLIPASTGIGAGNPEGAALVSGALAIRPRHAGVKIQEVASPLQNPATDYRSSFSRAVEIEVPGRRLLTISGTASIAPDGASVHQDDTVKQIHLTLDVVEAILKSRGMDWKDATRAVGYFHDIRQLPVFDACCRERGIPPLPLAPAHATVCRADLLFEMELDAAVSTPAPEAI